MKEIKALKIEDLSLDQKLGMLDAAHIALDHDEEGLEFIFDLISRRELGAVWIQWNTPGWKELIQRVRETADYPILIITDCESGMDDYRIAQANAIGRTGKAEYAYAYGKALGITARNNGYNVVCNPVLDARKGGSSRSFGEDKNLVAKLAAAQARGLQDAGILTVAKHYPSGENPKKIDSHMAEGYSEQTKEELLEKGLYPYIELMKENLLDGIMSGHHRFVNIDDTRPASLSRPMLNIIKERGFDGFFITDSLGMMGVVGKYGKIDCKGLCIDAGNDLALTYVPEHKLNHEAIKDCYRRGLFTEERLNEAVENVLRAQEKTLREPKFTELTKEEDEMAKTIDIASIFEKCDDGVSPAISREGKHLFALMTRNENAIDSDGKVEVDTFSSPWLKTPAVTAKILETFPNSSVHVYHQFPNNVQMRDILSSSIDYDDVVFLTFSENIAYTGAEHLTRRVETLINAAQSTDRVAALIHYGNPCVLNNLPHIPRVIIAGRSTRATLAAIDVLSGNIKAMGMLTHEATIN